MADQRGAPVSTRVQKTPEPGGVLFTIRPRHAEAIFAGTKTVELRRLAPRSVPGTVAVIYASGKARAVVGAATVGQVHSGPPNTIWALFGDRTGISKHEFDDYFHGKTVAYALELKEAYASQSPMSLGALRRHELEPPQSWRYLSAHALASLLMILRLSSSFPDGLA